MELRGVDSRMLRTEPLSVRIEFVPAPDWSLRALCLGRWGEFDTPEGGPLFTREQAAEMCAGCPVMAECLADALASEAGSAVHRNGVRGGLCESDRAALWSGRMEGSAA